MASNTISSDVVDALNGAQGNGNAGASADLQNSFMTLLITQLQNQDPLKPLENAELTSQLAQINMVSGIESLNGTLQGITEQIEAGQSLQAVELIGKGVLVPGQRVLVGEEGVATPFGVELEDGAEQVTAQIIGADGQVLSTLGLGALQAGVHTFSWDGKLDSGETAPSGAYTVTIQAVDADGQVVNNDILNYAIVNGINRGSNNSDLRLDLGGITEPVGLDEVRQIL